MRNVAAGLLEVAAARCRDQVLRHAGRRGFRYCDLVARVPAFDALGFGDQCRVLVALARMEEIASTIGAREEWYFYARDLAPPGAYTASRQALLEVAL